MMGCTAHRECPTSCRYWQPCQEPCDHDECQAAIEFDQWLVETWDMS